jgi:hypothetical protein
VAASNTVERKVYFYRARIEQADGAPAAPPFNSRETCDAVSRLQFVSGDRYLHFADGDSLAVWPKQTGTRSGLIIGSLRSSGLPELEQDGQFKKLQVGDTERIAEKTHVVFFENNIVGVEFNYYGPRVSRLSYYLRTKDVAKVEFDPLLNRDVQDQLKHLQDVRVLDLRLRRDGLDLLREGQESLPAALRGLSEKVDAPIVELILRQPPRSRKAFGSAMLDFVKTLAGMPQTREAAGLFKVHGKHDQTKKVEVFDLLEDKFVSQRTVPKEGTKHRVINSDSMFSEIESAYAELRSQLEQSVGVST